MATWHQTRAGLSGLYAAEAGAFKVVSDPPGGMASAVMFPADPEGEAKAIALAIRNGGRLIAPAGQPHDSAYPHALTVTLESGAVYLVRVNATGNRAAELAAEILAERAGGAKAWASPCPYPVSAAVAAMPQGAERLTAGTLAGKLCPVT